MCKMNNIIELTSHVKQTNKESNMNILPTPPTDSLYKFSAISGMLIIIFSLACYVYLTFQISNMQKTTTLMGQARLADKSIKEIDCRINAIKAGKVDECRYKEIKKENLQDELELLEIIKKNEISTIQEYDKFKTLSQPLRDNIDWVFNGVIYYIFMFIESLSCALLVFGFFGWYTNIQKPTNELTLLDLKIKRLELIKIEHEVKKISKHYRFSATRN